MFAQPSPRSNTQKMLLPNRHAVTRAMMAIGQASAGLQPSKDALSLVWVPHCQALMASVVALGPESRLSRAGDGGCPRVARLSRDSNFCPAAIAAARHLGPAHSWSRTGAPRVESATAPIDQCARALFRLAPECRVGSLGNLATACLAKLLPTCAAYLLAAASRVPGDLGRCRGRILQTDRLSSVVAKIAKHLRTLLETLATPCLCSRRASEPRPPCGEFQSGRLTDMPRGRVRPRLRRIEEAHQWHAMQHSMQLLCHQDLMPRGTGRVAAAGRTLLQGLPA